MKKNDDITGLSGISISNLPTDVVGALARQLRSCGCSPAERQEYAKGVKTLAEIILTISALRISRNSPLPTDEESDDYKNDPRIRGVERLCKTSRSDNDALAKFQALETSIEAHLDTQNFEQLFDDVVRFYDENAVKRARQRKEPWSSELVQLLELMESIASCTEATGSAATVDLRETFASLVSEFCKKTVPRTDRQGAEALAVARESLCVVQGFKPSYNAVACGISSEAATRTLRQAAALCQMNRFFGAYDVVSKVMEASLG